MYMHIKDIYDLRIPILKAQQPFYEETSASCEQCVNLYSGGWITPKFAIWHILVTTFLITSSQTIQKPHV